MKNQTTEYLKSLESKLNYECVFQSIKLDLKN